MPIRFRGMFSRSFLLAQFSSSLFPLRSKSVVSAAPHVCIVVGLNVHRFYGRSSLYHAPHNELAFMEPLHRLATRLVV